MMFSQALLIFWLSQNGFDFPSLIIYSFSSFFLALVGILYFPIKINSRKSIFLGILCSALSVLVLIKIFSPIQLYVSAILGALNIIFFWIPFNTMYFKYSSEEKRGLNSGILFLVNPIIGMTLQPLSGIIAEKFSFGVMFTVGMFLYLIPLSLIKIIPDFNMDLNVKKEIKILKFNWTTFFQGMLARVNYTLIPIFSLFFIKTPIGFGSFFGYLSLITVIASVLNGHISDKMKNRKHFFYIFTILTVVSFIPLAFSSNPYLWGIFAGISSLCYSLATPFWFTYNLDHYKELGVEKTIILREIFLGVGYTVSLLVLLLIYFIFDSTKLSLVVISILCCFMPIVSYFQGVYRNKLN